jgi:CDP-glucose 4,6-dehydratase
MQHTWKDVQFNVQKKSETDPHEARLLSLDCTKINQFLGWENSWTLKQTIQSTISWYKEYYANNSIITEQDIDRYVSDATKMKAIWTR